MRHLIVSRTPLRASFFGGGTDLAAYYERHGGRVLSFAIDRFVYVAVKAGWDDDLVIRCGRPQRTSSVDAVEHGIVREALRLTGQTRGLEIVSLSDAPFHGTGLGSSSTFTVGLLNALFTHLGEPRSAAELARLACHIEIDRLGAPIGRQDQYAAALGGCHQYDFHPGGAVTAERIDLSPSLADLLNRHVLVFYTGRTRRASDILASQQDRIRGAGDDMHTLKDMVGIGRRYLTDADMARLGGLLHAGWQLKKRLSDQVHDDLIDKAYERARRAGAYGGKILGAGGGGFLLLLCSPQRQAAVRAALSELREAPCGLGAPGTAIIVGPPASSGGLPLASPAVGHPTPGWR